MKTLLSLTTTQQNGLFVAIIAVVVYLGFQINEQHQKWQQAVEQTNFVEESYKKWINWSERKSDEQYDATDFKDVKKTYENGINTDLTKLKALIGVSYFKEFGLVNLLKESLAINDLLLRNKSLQLNAKQELKESLIPFKQQLSSTDLQRLSTVENNFLAQPDSAQALQFYTTFSALLNNYNSTTSNTTQAQLVRNALNSFQKEDNNYRSQKKVFAEADNNFLQSLQKAKNEFTRESIRAELWFFSFLGALIIILFTSFFYLLSYTKRIYYEPLNAIITQLKITDSSADIDEIDRLKSVKIPSELAALSAVFDRIMDKLNIQRDALSFLSLDDNSSSSHVGFISAAAREIRTPLNTLTNTISQLLESDAMKTAWADEIKELHHASFTLLALINQVVDLNKLQEGTLRLSIKPSSLLEQIKTITAIYRDKFNGKGVEFRLIVDESSLPEIVETDAVRLNQILLSLLQQAWRKTNRGSVTLDIYCLKKLTNECALRFQITDTGEGYEQEELELINQRSNSIVGVDSVYAGLFLSKSLLSYFNSSMNIDSEPELGTSIAFSMNFPIIHTLQRKEKTVLLTKMVNQVAAAEKQILIVDDNPVNLKITARILQKDMYNCTIAANAAEALALIETGKKFDVILMDLEMPQMDGLSCTEFIRNSDYQLAKTVPIIALTAASSDHIKEKAFMRGMNDYITKPFTPLELLNTVAKNIDLAKQFGHTA